MLKQSLINRSNLQAPWKIPGPAGLVILSLCVRACIQVAGLPLCLLPSTFMHVIIMKVRRRLSGCGKLIATVSIYGLIIICSDPTPIKVKVGGRKG